MELALNIGERPAGRDFHETALWREARCVVIALLDVAQSWSRKSGPQKVAREIETQSVSLLQQIIHGLPARTKHGPLSPAQHTIDTLEDLVNEMGNQGAMTQSDSLALKSALKSLKDAFATLER